MTREQYGAVCATIVPARQDGNVTADVYISDILAILSEDVNGRPEGGQGSARVIYEARRGNGGRPCRSTDPTHPEQSE
jgi:hypothetical protein